MTKRFLQWLDRKWQPVDQTGLREAYQVTFSTLYGQQVLQHLIDQSYATICESNHPIDLAAHNARRSVVHDILINIDVAAQPGVMGGKVNRMIALTDGRVTLID